MQRALSGAPRQLSRRESQGPLRRFDLCNDGRFHPRSCLSGALTCATIEVFVYALASPSGRGTSRREGERDVEAVGGGEKLMEKVSL